MPLPTDPRRAAQLGQERASLLKQLAAEANFKHRWAKSSAGAALKHAVAAGNALARARDLCDDGEWTSWLRRNFEATIRTAQRYIRLARHLPALERDATRVSPESQSEATRAIRRALFDSERQPCRSLATVPAIEPASEVAETPPAPQTRAPDVRALAIARLRQLAAWLRQSLPPGDAAAAHIIARVESFADDLRLDLSATRGDAADQKLYFIEAVGADRVKIGVASDPGARLAALQTASPHRLRLLTVVAGTRDLERATHARLADFHLGGEWFHLGKPVRALIDRFIAGNEAARDS